MKRDDCMDAYFVAHGLHVRPEPAVATLRMVFNLPWDLVSGLSRVLYRWQERIATPAVICGNWTIACLPIWHCPRQTSKVKRKSRFGVK
jgi:hypothetical protein